MNNYEKIKQMTVEEMAENIKCNALNECKCCIHSDTCLATEYQRKRCLDGIKQWLLQEVEE
jgi:hypothetical protein